MFFVIFCILLPFFPFLTEKDGKTYFSTEKNDFDQRAVCPFISFNNANFFIAMLCFIIYSVPKCNQSYLDRLCLQLLPKLLMVKLLAYLTSHGGLVGRASASKEVSSAGGGSNPAWGIVLAVIIH